LVLPFRKKPRFADISHKYILNKYLWKVILSFLSIDFKHHGMSFAGPRVDPFMKSSKPNSKNDPD
jgi:hypothetical protein